MRTTVAIAFAFVVCSCAPTDQAAKVKKVEVQEVSPVAAKQDNQQDDEKFLMERHKKVLREVIDKKGPGNLTELSNATTYLLKRRISIQFVEDFIIDARKVLIAERMYVWRYALLQYSDPDKGAVKVKDIPDKMIPELAHYLVFVHDFRPGDIKYIQQAGEFGARGKAFLPVLEEIRSRKDGRPQSDAVILAALDAVRKIKK